MVDAFEVVVPKLGYREYLPEIIWLCVGLLVPVAVLAVTRSGDWFERSGSISVFCAAVAQFVSVGRLNNKHILNACRARAGDPPWATTPAFGHVGKAAFAVGLMGTVIWGFGSKIL